MVPMLKSKSPSPPPTQPTSSPVATATTINPITTEVEVPAISNSGPISKTFHLPPRRQRGVRKTNPRKRGKEKNKPGEQSEETTLGALTAPAESQRALPPEDGQDAPPSRFTQHSVPEQREEHVATPSESSLKETLEDESTATDGKAGALYRESLVHRSGAHEGRDPYGLASLLYIHSRMPLPWPKCTLCEDKMPWLVDAVYREDGRDDEIGHGD